VKELLIESKSIGSDEVDIYLSSKYRVTTIIPFKGNPIMNIYLLTKDAGGDVVKLFK